MQEKKQQPPFQLYDLDAPSCWMQSTQTTWFSLLSSHRSTPHMDNRRCRRPKLAAAAAGLQHWRPSRRPPAFATGRRSTRSLTTWPASISGELIANSGVAASTTTSESTGEVACGSMRVDDWTSLQHRRRHGSISLQHLPVPAAAALAAPARSQQTVVLQRRR